MWPIGLRFRKKSSLTRLVRAVCFVAGPAMKQMVAGETPFFAFHAEIPKR
jgi:hypothetical protein